MNVLLLLLLCLIPMSMGVPRRSTPAACPRFPPLLHGSMTARHQGRRVKFDCTYPYKLVGFSYSTCGVHGWDHPAPVCVFHSLGCPVPTIANGSVMPTFNNAWLNFFCRPGFMLVGSPALYCDGTAWNGTAPTCVAETIEVQLSCNFERDLCGWRQDEAHDFDWTRHSNKTPSYFASTGPSYDHTFGNSGAGYYMYIESTSRRNNDSARLISPIFSSNLTQDGCFSLFYHMYGRSIGGLRVYQIPILPIVQLSEVERQDHLLFEKWGNQGNTWFRNVSRLRNTNSNFQIVIEGIRGVSFTSDVAIDDVAILPGNQCNDASLTAVTPPDLTRCGSTEVETSGAERSCANTNQYKARAVTSSAPCALETCRGRCEVSRPPPHRGCRCTIDCVSDETCCPDYLELCIFNSPPLTTTTTPNLGTTTTYENWTTESAWTTATWSDFEVTSEVGDHEGSTIASETTELRTMYDETDLLSTSPLTITSTRSAPPARPAPPSVKTAPTRQTTKPTATIPAATITPSYSTIGTMTTEQGTVSDDDDTTAQTPSGSQAPGYGNEHENLIKENVLSSSAILVMVLVPVICLVTVGLVVLMTLRNYKTIYSKVRRLHPFHFRATFTPNSGERGNPSEIRIYEFGNRSPGEEACTLRENSHKEH